MTAVRGLRLSLAILAVGVAAFWSTPVAADPPDIGGQAASDSAEAATRCCKILGGQLLVARTRARRSVAVLAGLACLVALAGCNSNPSPSPLPSSSPSASPSESPSPTPPTMPAEAKGTSEASAKAFVRYYIDVLNFAGPAGDARRLIELSDKSCAACYAIIELIEQVHSDGGYIRGDGWTIQSMNTVSIDSGKRPVLDAQVRVHPQDIAMSVDEEPRSYEGGRRLKTFWLARSQGVWVVTRLDQPQ